MMQSLNHWRTFDRTLPKVYPTLLGIVVLLMAGWCFHYSVLPAMTGPEDVRIADPASAVRHARALIADPAKHAEWLRPIDLPPSLRLPNLHHANVHQDHVDLILARNPDVSIGARIWAPRHRPHRDHPLPYRDIWFYRYDNDAPVGPENMP